MKKFLAVVALVAFISIAAFPAISHADREEGPWRCKKCGMFWSKKQMKLYPPKTGCSGQKHIKHQWELYNPEKS